MAKINLFGENVKLLYNNGERLIVKYYGSNYFSSILFTNEYPICIEQELNTYRINNHSERFYLFEFYNFLVGRKIIDNDINYSTSIIFKKSDCIYTIDNTFKNLNLI